MTSDTIQKTRESRDCSIEFWLAEIAYQLAVMNEREAAKVFTEMPKPTTTNVDGRYGRTKP